MEKYYIRFNSKEELDQAKEMAKELGYNYLGSDVNSGSLILYDDGKCQSSIKNIIDGYKELKLYKKLQPGTKVRIIKNNLNHYLSIGKIYTIKYFIHTKPYGHVYNINGMNVSDEEIEVVEDTTFKVGDLVTIGDCKTVYKIETISGGHMARIVHLKNKNRYDYHIDKLKLYTGTDTIEGSSTFNFGDKVKVIDVGKMCSTYDEAAEAMGLTKWIRSNLLYTSEQKESINNNNYYKIVGFHYRNKDECVGIENLIDGKQYIINSEGLEHINLSGSVLTGTSNLQDQLYTNTATAFAYALESTVAGTSTGCIDYPISYVDTSTVTVDKQGKIKNTLLTNNNTMEKLNQLRADKFFALEKNLTAIESLDTLLKDAIDLVNATGSELGKVSTKLIGLNRKLESATNNQDVAMLKDLIASTKVVQEFVDELKGKTISKFETAKTKFDVAGYLKD